VKDRGSTAMRVFAFFPVPVWRVLYATVDIRQAWPLPSCQKYDPREDSARKRERNVRGAQEVKVGNATLPEHLTKARL